MLREYIRLLFASAYTSPCSLATSKSRYLNPGPQQAHWLFPMKFRYSAGRLTDSQPGQSPAPPNTVFQI
jgi:hypothetical protein